MIKPIMLNDLLGFSEDELARVKVRFNQWDGSLDPVDEYERDPERVNVNWFLNKTKNNLFSKGEMGICLLGIEHGTWLLTTVKKILNVRETSGVGYDAEEIDRLRKYFGRIVIKCHKGIPQVYRWRTIGSQLEVLKVLEQRYERNPFRGYDDVCLSHDQLKAIIDTHKQDWFSALESQQAVYLITDKNTGKQYVGSATSKGQMLLARWSEYVKDGHGGNVELERIVKQNGLEYVRENFQYSILENFNGRVNANIVLDREKWWKKVLCSQKNGYNRN